MSIRDDFAAYQKIKAINWSKLKTIGASPKHYQHALTAEHEDTDTFALGRASHTAVFEPDRLVLDYAVWRDGRRAGNDWKAFVTAHEGQTILTLDQYERCVAIRDAVRAHPIARIYLERGEAEHTITWRDKETGLQCKARIDWHARRPNVLADLKTSADIELRKFARKAAGYGYHGQVAFYADGLAAELGESIDEVVFIAVESKPPHDVGVFKVEADVLYRGRELYRGLLCRVAGCTELGAWPGRYPERESLELPEWAMGGEEEVYASAFDDAEASMGDGL